MTELAGRLPLLAIPYGGLSLPLMTSAQAAAGLCSILWLVDGTDPVVRDDWRALHRFGQVVDLAGIPPDRWADAVAPSRPDGIVTFSDHQMVDLAHLAANLGLPFHRPEVARLLTDKAAQREAQRHSGLAVPGSAIVPAGLADDAVEAVAGAVSFPAVLKPIYGTDSRTTMRVEAAVELLDALRSLFGADRPDMLIEEYLPDSAPCLGEGFANYLSVESVVSDGNIEHFAVTGRFPLAPPFRETGFFIPRVIARVTGATVKARFDHAPSPIGAVLD